MGRIEKTVFISYRRTDEAWGLAVFQDLTQHGYDVFIDYDGIASGNFETVILENIRARAHFLVLLTPTALERSSDPMDWMRREIEAALDSRRNIVPLMLAGFDFDAPATASELTGKLAALRKYNGLPIPKGYFSPAMERLRNKFLNVPVDAVLHPTSDSAQQVAKEQKEKAGSEAKRRSEEARQRAAEEERRKGEVEMEQRRKEDAEAKRRAEEEERREAKREPPSVPPSPQVPRSATPELMEQLEHVPAKQAKTAAIAVPWRVFAGSAVICVIVIVAVWRLVTSQPAQPDAGTSTVAYPWPMPTGNYANHRYSQLNQITADNVSKLQVAWTFSTGVVRGHEGGPLVIDNLMYVHTPFPNKVYALDLSNDNKIVWEYEPKQDNNVISVMGFDTVNRGVTYGDGKIFLHQADTTLVALDAKTGKLVWSVKNGDPSKGETGTSAPMVIKDKVFIGISGGAFGARCHVTGYDAKTGKRAWRGYSMGPDSDMLIDPVKTTALGWPIGKDSSLKTWAGDQWKIGGGCAWGWISYDPQLNLLYYGSGNPGTWNPVQRPGDNKWSTTIWARNPDTGQAKWVYQMTPHDEWGYDGVNEMILTDQQVNGTMRKLLTHLDRNGLSYTLDRETGELLLAQKYDPKVNWTTGVDMNKNSANYGRPSVVSKYSTQAGGEDHNTTGICPSSMGSKNQQPAAFSPDTGLFYVPVTHLCMDYEPFRVSYTAGQPYVGATLAMYPPQGESNSGNFIAWDAKTGKIVWSKQEQFAVWSGALATAGGVVFYGTLEGYLKAVDANTGRELYKFKTQSGIVGNVITYENRGKQYVAVLSGIGGWPGIGLAAGLTNPRDGLGATGAFAALRNYTALGGQLTVFALP